MKKKLMILSGLSLGVLMPVVAFAQPGSGTLGGILDMILNLLNKVIPILIVLAIIWFIVGIIKYVVSGEEEAKKKSRDMMIYGIIGLAVIVGMWGLVNILLTTFDVPPGTEMKLQPPTFTPAPVINQ